MNPNDPANQMLDILDAKLERLEHPPKTKTVNELMNEWYDELNARFLSPHTMRNYLSDVKQFLEFYAGQNIDPLKLDRQTARLFLAHLTKKYTVKSTIMRKRDSVMQFYKFLKSDGHIRRNEFQFFDRMKVNQDLPKFLSQGEVARLLESIAPNPEMLKAKFSKGPYAFDRSEEAAFLAIRDKALLELLYSCGTRAQETANLNWVDIDFRAGFIRVNNGKGGRDREIPIGETAMDALWEYGKAYREQFKMEPAGINPVFLSRRRMRTTTRSIQRAVELRLKLAGIDTKMRTHGLRHSMATHLMQSGAGIVEIAAMLGHAVLSNTQKYVHVSMKEVTDHYDRAHPRA